MVRNMNNLIIKVLVFSVVLSLLPLLVEISPIEYQGASLMAADDDKKKKKRRRTKLPSKKAQKILQQLQPLIEAEAWDEAVMLLTPMGNLESKFTDRKSVV